MAWSPALLYTRIYGSANFPYVSNLSYFLYLRKYCFFVIFYHKELLFRPLYGSSIIRLLVYFFFRMESRKTYSIYAPSHTFIINSIHSYCLILSRNYLNLAWIDFILSICREKYLISIPFIRLLFGFTPWNWLYTPSHSPASNREAFKN
jgi:hypothetical protein